MTAKKSIVARREELIDQLYPGRRGLGAWSAFIRAHATLSRAMDVRLQEATGCSLADFDVLSQIGGADGRLRMAELADRVLVSRSGLTRRVARLEEEGLVQRCAADDDGRGVVVCLTEAGVKRMTETTRAHAGDVKALFMSLLSDSDLETIERALRKVIVDCSFG